MTHSTPDADGVLIVWQPTPGEVPGARVLRFGVVLTPGEPQRVRADIAARVLEAYPQVRTVDAPPVAEPEPPAPPVDGSAEPVVETHDDAPPEATTDEPVPDHSEPDSAE